MVLSARGTAHRFSTDDLPPRERIPFWREVFGRSIVKLDMEPIGEGPFRCDADLRAFPGLGMALIGNSPVRTVRTRPLIAADANDDVVFGVLLKGTALGSQRGWEPSIAEGEGAAMRNGEPGSFTLLSHGRMMSLRIPTKVLAPMISDFDKATKTVVPADGAAMRLLTGYVAQLERDNLLDAPELRHAVATHIQDLVAVAIGATRDAAVLAEGRGVRAARIRAIKADILAQLGRVDLSLTALAARHGVTPRYIRMLFETEDLTFSEFVLQQRLVRAHRLLTDPRLADRTISALAYQAGFGDLSHFNRAFRGHFGCTPSELRADARRDGEGR